MTVPVPEAWGQGKSFELSIFRVVSPESSDFYSIWARGGILRAPGSENRPHRRSGDSSSEEILFRVRVFLEVIMLGMMRRRVMRRMMREPGAQRRRRRMRTMGILWPYSMSMSSGGRTAPPDSFFCRQLGPVIAGSHVRRGDPAQLAGGGQLTSLSPDGLNSPLVPAAAPVVPGG